MTHCNGLYRMVCIRNFIYNSIKKNTVLISSKQCGKKCVAKDDLQITNPNKIMDHEHHIKYWFRITVDDCSTHIIKVYMCFDVKQAIFVSGTRFVDVYQMEMAMIFV